jgi:hypothetical protein
MTRTSLNFPPGIVSDDTTHEASGRWADGSNVRFRLGQPQTIGGWEALTDSRFGGVCRWILPWSANDGQLHLAFGTHTGLAVWVGGGLYNISPAGLAPGQIDGTGQAGYGTGPYGAGGYATPTIDDYYPRTWSGGAFGQDLIASPRLGTIYQWDPSDPTEPASPVAGAPERVAFCLVAPQDQIFALGCNEEASGEYNPLCIRHSGVRRATEWLTDTPGDSTAREYVLSGGGRIMGGRTIGAYLLVWTEASVFLGTFVGQLGQVWRFDKVGDHCGLIGPNAAVVVGQSAYWISPDKQFWSYTLGGEPQPMACTIRDDFAENLAAAQADKIVASSLGDYSEIWWDYPDARDGHENSRYVAVPIAGPDTGAWYRGRMARTARVDAGPGSSPLAVATEQAVLPYAGAVTDDGDCATALRAIGGVNLYAKADWAIAVGAAITPTFGVSGWGFRITGPVQGGFRAQGYTAATGAPYSISFKARASTPCRVVVGWRDALNNVIDPANPDVAFDVGLSEQTFKIENIVSDDVDFPTAYLWFFTRPSGVAGALPAGGTLDITDLKFEAGTSATAWSPAISEPNLHVVYGSLIKGLTYGQPAGQAYWHERGRSADGQPLAWHIESADHFMSEDNGLLVRSLWPDAQGQVGPVTLTLTSRFKPRGAETVRTYSFGPDAEKIDIRASGRLFKVKFAGESSPTAFRLGRPVLDAVPTGVR